MAITGRRVTARRITARRVTGRRVGLSGGAAPTPFTPSDLFGESDYGDWWDFRTADGLFIADDGATDPVSIGDPIGSAVGRRGIITLSQSSTSFKPILYDGYIVNPIDGNAGTLVGSMTTTTSNVTGLSLLTVARRQEGGTLHGSFGTGNSSHFVQLRESAFQGRWGSNSSSQTKTESGTNLPDQRNYACIYGPPSGEGDVKLKGTGVPDPVVVNRNTASESTSLRLEVATFSGFERQSVGAFYINRALTEEEIEGLIEYFGAVL